MPVAGAEERKEQRGRRAREEERRAEERPAADAIGQRAEERVRHDADGVADRHARQQQAVTELQRLNAVRQAEDRREVEGRRLGHRAEQHLERRNLVALQHREKRHALGRSALDCALEDRRFLHLHAHVEADREDGRAGDERHAPAPGEQLLLRQRADGERRERAEHRAGGGAARDERGKEAARVAGRALHRQQRPAADSAPSEKPCRNRRQTRTSGAAMPIGREGRRQADQRGRGAHEDERRHHDRLAPDAVAEVREEHAADRPGREPTANTPKPAMVPASGLSDGKNRRLSASGARKP